MVHDWSLQFQTFSGSRRAETIDNEKARYKKIFPDIAKHFFHDDVGVTKMVGFPHINLLLQEKSAGKCLSQSRLMAIAEPFCETYKPSVREDGSCYWDEEPTEKSVIQKCNATEVDKEERIIFWDSLFKPVNKKASVVTEFNLVSRQCNWLALKLTLLRSVIVSFFESSGTASLEEDPSLVPS